MQGNPYGGYSSMPSVSPTSVKATRIMLYVVGGLHVLTAIGLFAYSSHSAEVVGRLFVFALPGIASVVLGGFVGRRTRAIWWLVIALQVVYILVSLGRLANGNPGGLLELCFPIAILVLVTRSRARGYFRTSA